MSKLWSQLSYHENDPLLFNSSFFLFFFTFFLVIFTAIYRFPKLRKPGFTLLSLYFFYKTCGWYVGFILLASVFDYYISHKIYEAENKKLKKQLLISSILLNIGLLFYFKYTNFFIGIINDCSHHQFSLLKLILPVGISFYTFENLSYTIDVYRGTIKPVRKWIDYIFFLSFFPKLMMGPIVRAADFLPQINRRPFVTNEMLAQGLYLITAGIIKKVIISDYINANYVIYIFNNPSAYSGIECLLAVYGYAMVIYCDFSGYSDMALGMAKWMGFEIDINFISPYQSNTLAQFWRRWHISLSNWLKDYIYIPLGGNRSTTILTYRNLIITMLIGGFWHGASFNFIIWGGLHGCALALERFRTSLGRKYLITLPHSAIATKALATIFTFHFVCGCWIFFRCANISESFAMLKQITTQFHPHLLKSIVHSYKSVLIMLIFAFALHAIPIKQETKFQHYLTKQPLAVKIIYLLLIVFIAIQFKQADAIKPVYLQF